MKLRTKTDQTNIVGTQMESSARIATWKIANLIDSDFFDYIKEHWSEWKILGWNGNMKLFVLGRKKYVVIIWKNQGVDKSVSVTYMPDDIKAWYGAVLEWYKIISEHIYKSYLPDKPPYEIAYPKPLKYKHTDETDFVLIEWLDNLVSLQDIATWNVRIPSQHISPINKFLHDWDSAIGVLSEDSGIRDSSKYTSKYWQFIVKMPYGDVIVEDDFWLRLNGNGAKEEHLYNGGYLKGTKANEKPIVYFTDCLIAAEMKAKE
jgi:hypothetical protein